VSRVEQLVNLGIEAFQTGRLDDAAGYLTNALAAQPDHALANNCLGIVRRVQGDYPGAITCYERALSADPQYAEAHNNLGVACEATADTARAIQAYEAALRIKPDFAAARNNLGNALTKSNRCQEALAHLREALRLKPEMAAAHNNLGLALSHLGRLSEAEQSFRQALKLDAWSPETYLNLGNVLRAARKLEAATECYCQALQLNTTYSPAHVGVGNVLFDQGRTREAMAEYELALVLQPKLAEAHFGMGNAWSALEADEEAIAAWHRALELRPDYAEAHNNLGTLYHRQSHSVLAEREFLQAVEHKPDLVAAHNNLGNLYREQDRMDLAARSYQEILKRQPDRPLKSLRLSTLCPAVWTDRAAMEEYRARVLAEWKSLEGSHPYQDLSDLLAVANEPPYNLQFLDGDIRPLKEAYARVFRYTGPTYHPRPRSGPIKIGLVVTPTHEVAFLRLIWSALKRLDPSEFQTSILCTRQSDFLLRAALSGTQSQLVALPNAPHKIVHAVREQQFDILYYFEICTDSLNYFLPFFRLAPVQVTSWGIQVTSGIPNVDAYLSSGQVESEEADEHYSERLCRAGTLLTYQTAIDRPVPAKSRESFGLRGDQHVYFCVQHLGKFHPDFDDVLAGILRQDPRGVVVATQDKHGFGARRLRERFNATIPDVADRIVFLPRQAFQDYVSLALASDVMLDPIHFGGVTTTYDCLSLDKPIVTCPSHFQRGRYTLGCYRRMGIYDCVANSADDYVRLAVRLGTDRDWRQHVSRRIHESQGRLFEDSQAIAEHERLFRDLAHRSRAS
jgi:predicted O-linked N-acetylglucosamine transferase (SPINDLY family)